MKKIIMHITLLLSYGTSYTMNYKIMAPKRHSYAKDWPGESRYHSHFTAKTEGDYAQEWTADDALTHHDLRLSETIIKLPSCAYLSIRLEDLGCHALFMRETSLDKKLGGLICTPQQVYDIVTEALEEYGDKLPDKSGIQTEVPFLYRPDFLSAVLARHPYALYDLETKGLLE